MSSAVEICLAQEAKLKDTQVKENAVRFNPTTYQFERWTGSAWSPVGSNIDESNPVHKTGNETISGTKTFNSTIVGSVSGNATSATKLSTARTIQTNLASTSTDSFDGTANVTPGVTGILPVANGGTGNSTGKAPSAVIADSATTAESALKDGVGNTIADTYVKTVNSKAPSGGNVDIPSRNVGDEWHSFTGKIPAGGVPYCGQTVTRATYADLWAYVQDKGLVKTETEWQSLSTSQNGNVPFYSDGDGSTTFRMPKIVGYIKGAADVGETGVYAYGELTVTGSTTTDALATGLANVEAEINRRVLTVNGNTPDVNGNISPEQTGCLPLSGGTMTGSIVFSNNGKVAEIYTSPADASDYRYFGIYANGSGRNGGSFQAFRTDSLNLSGCFLCRAEDESGVRDLVGWTNGNLQWNNHILTHVAEYWSDGNLWYRKWSDGWIEQGGIYGASTGGETVNTTVNFPTPFSNVYYSIVGVGFVIYNCGRQTVTRYTTGFVTGSEANYSGTAGWYACGY